MKKQKSLPEPQSKVKGSGMDRVALGRGPLPVNDQKRSILVAGDGPEKKKKKAYRKMIRFSVCASDFSSQRKKRGE